MEIPKFHETFVPILKVLENGEILQTREMYQKVIEQYYSELSKDQLEEKTKSGDTLIYGTPSPNYVPINKGIASLDLIVLSAS